MRVHQIPIEEIRRRQDARPLNDDMVASLADSIDKIGLVNPIRVRQVGECYEVIAGSHRFAAVDSLGHPTIAAIVAYDDDLHAELAMIDENLMRAELSPADRAGQTARRKAIYLEMHPDTAHGANLEGSGVAKFATPDIPTFTKATSKVTGQSERAVRLDVNRGERLEAEALSAVRGTPLDRGNYLDKLKTVPREQQVERVREDLARPPAPGGIAGRYAAATKPKPPSADTFEEFVRISDRIMAMPVADLLEGAGAKRSVLGQRASSLASMCDKIMEGI